MPKKSAKKKTSVNTTQEVKKPRPRTRPARKKSVKSTTTSKSAPVQHSDTSQPKVVRATEGKNLPTVLSRNTVKTPYAAVGGLVCNAYNHDATEVFVTLDPTLETLEIKYSGPGTGMDQEGIREFLTLGGKIRGNTPVLNRKRVGQKRLTKAFIGYLGERFSLRTVKEGKLHSIDDAFVDGEIDGDEKKVSEPEGTTLTIRGLNFEPSKAFQSKLLLRLQWDTPNRPDFNTFFNGQLVQKKSVVQYAAVYEVDEKVRGGSITGRIYCRQDKKTNGDLPGVFLYVNGKSVTELSSYAMLLNGRLQGELHADHLSDAVTLSGTSVQDRAPFRKVKDVLKTVTESIVEDLKQGELRRAYYATDKRFSVIEGALIAAQDQLNLRLEKDYELKLATQERAGAFARYDPDESTVHLNTESRMFTFLKDEKGQQGRKAKYSEVYLKRAFLIAAAFALTNHSYKDNPRHDSEELAAKVASNTDITFADYPGIKRDTAKFLGDTTIFPLSEVYLNPYRLYDHSELSHMTGRPAHVVRLLHTSGALQGSEEHLFSKNSILECLTSIEGYVSCIEVADPRYTKIGLRGVRVMYDYPKSTPCDNRLTVTEVPPELSLINIGTIHPLFFVPLDKKDQFKTYADENTISV